MSEILERFLRDVRIDTQWDENSRTSPLERASLYDMEKSVEVLVQLAIAWGQEHT